MRRPSSGRNINVHTCKSGEGGREKKGLFCIMTSALSLSLSLSLALSTHTHMHQAKVLWRRKKEKSRSKVREISAWNNELPGTLRKSQLNVFIFHIRRRERASFSQVFLPSFADGSKGFFFSIVFPKEKRKEKCNSLSDLLVGKEMEGFALFFFGDFISGHGKKVSRTQFQNSSYFRKTNQILNTVLAMLPCSSAKALKAYSGHTFALTIKHILIPYFNLILIVEAVRGLSCQLKFQRPYETQDPVFIASAAKYWSPQGVELEKERKTERRTEMQ